MRVPTAAIFVPCLWTGGTEVATLQTAGALQALGMRVTVIVYFDEVDPHMVSTFRGCGIELQLLGLKRTPTLSAQFALGFALLRALAGVGNSLLWIQYMTPTLVPLLIARPFCRNLVAEVHFASSHYSAAGLRRVRWLGRFWCSRMVFVSETSARGIIGSRKETLRSSTVVIPNTFDAASVEKALPHDWRAAFDWPREVPVLGFVGRLSRNKGMDILLNAMAVLVGSGEDVRLVVAGDGEERASLEALAERLSMGSKVRFVGRLGREKVYGALKGFDIAVVPSREEGFGLSALESMAAGTPLVAARIDALTEVVIEGRTGLLFEPGDHTSLATVLARLLTDPHLRQRLSEAGRHHATQTYGAAGYLRRVADLLRQLQGKESS